jgi:hypothetical protein
MCVRASLSGTLRACVLVVRVRPRMWHARDCVLCRAMTSLARIPPPALAGAEDVEAHTRRALVAVVARLKALVGASAAPATAAAAAQARHRRIGSGVNTSAPDA